MPRYIALLQSLDAVQHTALEGDAECYTLLVWTIVILSGAKRYDVMHHDVADAAVRLQLHTAQVLHASRNEKKFNMLYDIK